MLDETRGVAFPFRIDPVTGGVAWASGSEKIRQNVRLILGVRLGERPMLRDFGSRISSLVHEPNDDVIADLIQNQTRQALLQWEPRILVTTMQVEQQEGEARVRLHYVHSDEPVANQMLISIF